MKAAAKKLSPPPIPTLAERATALLEELLEAPAAGRREILTWWREALDDALLDLAEELRPKGETKVDAQGQSAVVGSIPVGWIKMQLHQKGYGECPCKAMAEALKDAS
jgi:hypothetical protein